MNKTKMVVVSIVMVATFTLFYVPIVNSTTYYYAVAVYPEHSFDYPEWSTTAIISNLGGLRYTPDGNEAYLHVKYYRAPPSHSDEAFIVARMAGQCRKGVWLRVRAQPSHQGSYIMVCYSNSVNTPYGDWIWLPYVWVYSTSSQWIYVGYASTPFKYIAVCLYSQGYPGLPDHNGVYVDAIRAEAYDPIYY